MTTTQTTLTDLLGEAAVEIDNLDGTDNPVYRRLREAQGQIHTLASGLRETLEKLKQVDYWPNPKQERSPPYVIGWTKRELERAIEVLEQTESRK